MAALKNVVLAGATGNLGPAILDSLVSAGFNVTVFRRAGSSSTVQSGVKVVDVDYTSVDALTKALRGQDAVVSTLAVTDLTPQDNLIDASIAAGVQRFIPSEFGSDTANPKSATLPVFAGKIAAISKLEKDSQSSSLSYTAIRNSVFLDWGLQAGFILDLKDGTPTLYNGGDRPFSSTLLSDVGKAVVGVLNHPAETKNRAVYIASYTTTQNKLLSTASKIHPGKSYTPKIVQTKDLTAKSFEELKTGNTSYATFFGFLFASIFEEGYGGEFTKTDNELLGIKTLTDAEFEKIWRGLV